MALISVLSQTLSLPTQFFLTASGNGQGVYNLNGDYSAAPIDFYYEASTLYDMHSFLISITDSANFNQEDYGAIASGTIVNGVKVYYYNKQANVERLLLSGIAFKKNYEWFSITAGVGLTTFSGTPQTLRINFDLLGDYGVPFRLNVGDRFGVRLNDNFTGLVQHTFGIRGSKS